MKTIVGTVIQVSLNTQVKKKDGGTYPGWQLIYNTDGKVETIAKHQNSLKYSPTLKAALETLAAGDPIAIDLEKGETGYWEVLSIRKGEEMPTPAGGGAQQPARKYQTDKSSTYETPEERALRQALIVRQSSVTSAIAALPGSDMKTILKAAKQIEDHVWAGYENKKSNTVSQEAAPEVE